MSGPMLEEPEGAMGSEPQQEVSAHLAGVWEPCYLGSIAFLGTSLPASLLFAVNSSHDQLSSSNIP